MMVAFPPAVSARARGRRLIVLCVGVALGAGLPPSARSLGQPPTPQSVPTGNRNDSVTGPALGDDVTATELLQKLDDNQLSSAQILAAATRTLQLQADGKTAWDRRWGDFLEKAHERGKLATDLWSRYVLGAVQLEVKVAAEATRADGLPIWYEFKTRGGAHWPDDAVAGWREDDVSGVRLSRLRPGRDIGRGIEYYDVSAGGWGWTEKLTDARWACLQPGPQTYHYRFHIALLKDAPADNRPQAKPPGERIIEGTLHWTLLADNHAPTPPTLKADEALRPAVEKCLRIQALRDTRDTSLVELMIQVDHPPVGMGFEVSLRSGDRTQLVGPVAWSTEIGWWAFDVDVPPGITTVGLVFTPSAAAAAKLKRRNAHRLMGLESIWNGEAILKHVTISSQRLGGMIDVAPPNVRDAREDQIEQLEGDDPVIEQVKRGGDLATARRQLERSVQEPSENAVAWFNLGCLKVAAGDWRQAPECFANARRFAPASPLADKAQRQLRQIGGYFVHAARNDDAGAMCGLGVMYQRGWGPKPDRQEAKRWFRSAVLAGNAEAMCHVAAMYEQDLAAGPANPQAETWYRQQVRELYRQAADLGDEEARKWVATHDRR